MFNLSGERLLNYLKNNEDVSSALSTIIISTMGYPTPPANMYLYIDEEETCLHVILFIPHEALDYYKKAIRALNLLSDKLTCEILELINPKNRYIVSKA